MKKKFSQGPRPRQGQPLHPRPLQARRRPRRGPGGARGHQPPSRRLARVGRGRRRPARQDRPERWGRRVCRASWRGVRLPSKRGPRECRTRKCDRPRPEPATHKDWTDAARRAPADVRGFQLARLCLEHGGGVRGAADRQAAEHEDGEAPLVNQRDPRRRARERLVVRTPCKRS